MALILQALGLEAKDQGVSESVWIVQIAGTIIFQKKIHSWKTPIMRSVLGLKDRFFLLPVPIASNQINNPHLLIS